MVERRSRSLRTISSTPGGREVDPATTSEYSQALAPIENALEIAAGKVPVDKLGVESMGPQTFVVHLHAPTPYLLALVGNNYLYPIYAPAVKQWGDALDATRPHDLQRAVCALRSRPQRAHYAAQESALLGRRHVRLSRVNYHRRSDNSRGMNQYLAGDLDFTDRIPALGKGPPTADAWRPSGALSLFYDRDVQLQCRQTALHQQSKAARGAERGSGPGCPRKVRHARHRSARLRPNAAV